MLMPRCGVPPIRIEGVSTYRLYETNGSCGHDLSVPRAAPLAL